MHTQTYVVARNSGQEATYAAIQATFTAGACSRGLPQMSKFREAVKKAVTKWIKETKEGKAAWEDSGHDFNIGDLANERLEPINSRMPSGVQILSIDVHSMDASGEAWKFDDVLGPVDK